MWVFRFGLFAVFRGSCLATSNEKLECEKNSGYFYASVNGSIVWKNYIPEKIQPYQKKTFSPTSNLTAIQMVLVSSYYSCETFPIFDQN